MSCNPNRRLYPPKSTLTRYVMIPGAVTRSFMFASLTLILPGLSYGAGLCKVAAGSCPVSATVDGESCFCNSMFGTLEGAATVTGGTDISTGLVQQAAQSAASTSLTLQIFGKDADVTNLSRWL